MNTLERSPRGSAARFFEDLRDGSRRQGNVIFALIFKEVKTRAGADAYGLYSLVAVIVEPAIAVASMMVFFYFLRSTEVNGVHVALFLAVSYMPFGLVRRAMDTIPKALRSNAAFYAYQQVKPIDSILARFILESALLVLGGFLVFFILWWFLGLQINFNTVPQAVTVLAILFASCLGISLFLGTYGTLYPSVLKVTGSLSRVLFIASGVIHPLSYIHEKIGSIMLWNPLAHIEELLRFYTLGMKPNPGVTMTYPAMFALEMLFLGFAGYYANRLELLKR